MAAERSSRSAQVCSPPHARRRRGSGGPDDPRGVPVDARVVTMMICSFMVAPGGHGSRIDACSMCRFSDPVGIMSDKPKAGSGEFTKWPGEKPITSDVKRWFLENETRMKKEWKDVDAARVPASL